MHQVPRKFHVGTLNQPALLLLAAEERGLGRTGFVPVQDGFHLVGSEWRGGGLEGEGEEGV